MRCRKISSVSIAALFASGFILTGGSTATAEPAPSDNPADNPVVAYATENPMDFEGINAVAEREFGQSVEFALVGVDGPVDAATATSLSESAQRAEVGIESVSPTAYDVSAFWSPTWFGRAIAVGMWSFQDDATSQIGGPPEDLASLGINFASNCFTMGTVSWNAFAYDHVDNSSAVYVQNPGSNGSPVFGLNDQTSAGKLNVDHGTVTANIVKNGNCGPTTTDLRFRYEHNENGGQVDSVSATAAALNVTYSGGTASVQKSTPAISYTVS